MKRVLLGVSGGIDSLAASVFLKRENFEIVPLYLILTDSHFKDAEKVRDLYLSRGVKLEARDERDHFKKNIIEYFADSYRAGLTPNPCAMCNRLVKFPLLKKYALELGCDGFSTGHYIGVENERIFKGRDESKDQSYFVSTVRKADLEGFVKTPLSKMNKSEVRKAMEEEGIKLEEKESQEICFIANDDYANYLESRCGFERSAGYFTDDEGKRIGEHAGYYRFTVGERRNLGMGFNKRMYVKSIDSGKNEVRLTERQNLLNFGFRMEPVEVFEDVTGREVAVKTRYRQSETTASAVASSQGRIEIHLSSGIEAITPGQVCVIYERDKVIASGIITKEIW